MKRSGMVKIMFVVIPHSVIDIITNSSSELFVFTGNSKDTIINIIKEIYPNYSSEYSEPINISELTSDQLNMFIDYHCSTHVYPATKYNYPLIGNYAFDELYEPESNEPAWNGQIQYRLKNNIINPQSDWKRSFVTDENREDVISKIDPERKMYFLFSLDDNPDWDYQEKLELVATRYHLG